MTLLETGLRVLPHAWNSNQLQTNGSTRLFVLIRNFC
jgi:hypothetical protein